MDLQPPDLRVQAPVGPQPAQQFAQGFDVGTGITGVVNATADRQVAQQQQQVALQRQQEQQRDIAAVVNNQNPAAGDYARLITKYPELADKFAKGWDVLQKDQQEARIQQAAPVFAAVKAGNTQLALKLMDDHITALQNSGAPQQQIGPVTAMRNVIEANPSFALHSMGLMLASTLGADKFSAMFGKAGEEQRANDLQPVKKAEGLATATSTLATAGKTEAETREVAANAQASRANISSEISNRADRLSLDKDKLQTETQLKLKEIEQKSQFGGNLPESARKIVNDSVVQATVSRNTATQARTLAKQFDDPNVSNGLTGKTLNKLKELTGNENYYNQLRNEYAKIRATAVRAGIPQGPASDKDVAFASKGFLDESASPKEIASFLRGMAGMQDYNARYENIKAEWAGAVGHLGKTPRDVDIDGVKVPAGYTLDDFVKKRLETPIQLSPPAPGAETNYRDKYKDYGVPAPLSSVPG